MLQRKNLTKCKGVYSIYKNNKRSSYEHGSGKASFPSYSPPSLSDEAPYVHCFRARSRSFLLAYVFKMSSVSSCPSCHCHLYANKRYARLNIHFHKNLARIDLIFITHTTALFKQCLPRNILTLPLVSITKEYEF
jgi:hypothetical protein